MYNPEKCPFGDCENNYVVEVRGRIYDCEVCQQVHIMMDCEKREYKEEP